MNPHSRKTMIAKKQQRILIGRLVILALTGCGLVAGYLVASAIALLLATNSLEHASQSVVEQDNASLSEARTVLAALQASSAGSCSDAEIAKFRSLVFRSQYVKDAGRIRGNKIQCSVSSGRPLDAIAASTPYLLGDGTMVYRRFMPIRNTDVKASALRLGGVYVVFGTKLAPAPAQTSAPLAAAETAGTHQQASVTTQSVPETALDTVSEGRTWTADTLSVTGCSDTRFSCAVASAPVSDTLHAKYGLILSGAFLGGVAGSLLGLIFSLFNSRRQEMSKQLRRALQKDELDVRYQPIVDMQTRQIVGAEALARWSDEDANPVNPEVFVKAAEDCGFSSSLTRNVLQRTLRDFAETLRSRIGFRISLNVAASDLSDPGFLPMLENSLAQAGVAPESIVIEITERSAATSAAAMESIRNLRRCGHSIHIDDFGCGYSNLDTLLYLHATTIKIDKAFINTIGGDSLAGVVLPQMMAMAKSLNLDVIVEGIETTSQADYFASFDQQIHGQGWLFGRPMTSAAFHSELANSPVEAKTAPVGYAAYNPSLAG
jgi:sensor c-di-GMP phosphodiesterase-like protein